MLRIKLARVGSKNRPAYRIVVAEDRSKLSGAPAAYLGSYHPFEKKFEVDKALYADWLGKGAIPTTKVAKLVKSKGDGKSN